MLNALEFVKAETRMCKHFKDKNDCKNCPVNFTDGQLNKDCVSMKENHPDSYVSLVEYYADTYPFVSNRMKFEEVFGEDLLECDGIFSFDYKWADKEYEAPEREKE